MSAIDLLWDLFQQRQIGRLDTAIDVVRTERAEKGAGLHEVQRLDAKIDRLALICRAMFELLQASGITEEQLREKIVEIDLRDGEADGRARPRPKECPECGAMMSPQFGRCLFCGHKDDAPMAFG